MKETLSVLNHTVSLNKKFQFEWVVFQGDCLNWIELAPISEEKTPILIIKRILDLSKEI